MHNAQYPTQAMTLEAGDILLLASDGLMELFNNEQEELGLVRIQEHFEQYIANVPNNSAAQGIITSLDGLADAWRGAVPQADDIAYLVLRAVL
jgi:serine phosphatase RsbU (regulator of sigma subunit)